nr:hypothetical protein KPHV_22480 [Kitasatospora purpeofusca]
MPGKLIDPHASLAFSLTTVPGGYAVLLGAGVSIAAGMPSAWDVQRDLIVKLAAVRKAEIDNSDEDAPFAWYAEEFGKPAAYDDLLDSLTSTPNERQALLKEYFEPTAEEREQGLKRPSAAHQMVAQLVATGHLKIVMTLNFDRLMETALREAGIEPTVISTPADITGMLPLHAQTALVVHLHGDYLNPASMLNTTEELATYDPATDTLLDQVLDEYGLLIAGWSAKWDPALRAAISRCPTRRFATYWIDPAPLSEIATELLTCRRADFVHSDADAFLTRAAEAVIDITTRQQHPASTALAVARAKRELASGRPPIELHDALHEEAARLADHPLRTETFDAPDVEAEHTRRLTGWQQAAETHLSLVATTVYWGAESSDRFWFDDIERFAPAVPASGMTSLIKLVQVPATMLLYTAGVAAAAVQRWTLVARLLTEPMTTNTYNGEAKPVAALLGPEGSIGLNLVSSERLYQQLKPIFTTHLALGERGFTEAWERFEYLRLIVQKEAGCYSESAHIRATTDGDRYRAAPSEWLDRELARDGAAHQLLTAQLLGGDLDRLYSAKAQYDDVFARWVADRMRTRFPFSGYGYFYPDALTRS